MHIIRLFIRNFKNELLFCTGETYMKNKQLLEQIQTSVPIVSEQEVPKSIFYGLDNY